MTKAATTASKASAGRYIEAVGRRKTAIARVRIFAGKGHIQVEGKDLNAYFQVERLQGVVRDPLLKMNLGEEFDVTASVAGGGINAQAEAIRLGLARALVKKDAEMKKRLRAYGFVTRDPRAVERKKYGLKKARRSPQWSKR